MAHPPARGGAIVRARAGLVALALAGLLLSPGPGPAADGDLADLVGAYLKTGAEQAPGAVAARAYVEPTRPSGRPGSPAGRLGRAPAVLGGPRGRARRGEGGPARLGGRLCPGGDPDRDRAGGLRARPARGGRGRAGAQRDHRRPGRGAGRRRARGRVAGPGLAGRGAHGEALQAARSGREALSARAVQRDLFPGHLLADARGRGAGGDGRDRHERPQYVDDRSPAGSRVSRGPASPASGKDSQKRR